MLFENKTIAYIRIYIIIYIKKVVKMGTLERSLLFS